MDIKELVEKYRITYNIETRKIYLYVRPSPEIAREVTERKEEIVAYIKEEKEATQKSLNEKLAKIKVEPNIDDYDMENPLESMRYWNDRKKYYESLPTQNNIPSAKSPSEMSEEEKRAEWERINNL